MVSVVVLRRNFLINFYSKSIFEKCEKKVRIKKQERETNIIQFPKRRQDKA